MSVEVDVAIVGGGRGGASLAMALQPTGLSVALIESVAPQAAQQPSFDDRTTALGNGSRRIFEALGIWSQISAQAAPIEKIHISDAGRYGFARLDCREHDLAAFGYVVTNRVLGAALRAGLQRDERLALRMPARCTEIVVGEQSVRLSTAPQQDEPICAQLLIAADGAQSMVREQMGIAADIEDYAQVAVIAHVASSHPAEGIAYERFTPTGPFAVLPLHDGHYGVVWTLEPAAAERVMALSDAEYLAELQRAFGWRAGRWLRVGKRSAYPLKLTRATALTGLRSVLIGNAAQGLHPVAGQGFNLGLRDAATLAELLAQTRARDAAADLGGPSVLAEFAARRQADREGVVRFTDTLVKVFGEQRFGVPALRDLGLLLFDMSPTAKQALSRINYGFAGHTPRLARGLPL
jgi:2-octaprenyl-6-methoxyphenol hydroxylase